MVRWSHKCPWKAITQGFNQFFQFTCLAVGNRERIHFKEYLWWGDQSFCSQYPNLYRVVSMRNLSISMVLGLSPPSTLDLQFRRNLIDLEIEHLQSLIFYCFCASFLFYCRFKILVGVLSSTSLFTIKSFSLALFMSLNFTVFQPTKFLWK